MLTDIDLVSIQEVRIATEEARLAQKQFQTFTQQQVDQIVEAIAHASYQKAEQLAVLAVSETKMGIIEHKKIKNELASKGVFESIIDKKTVGILNEDYSKRIVEIAYPFGVIAAVTPVTNPTATAIFKTMIALKTKNAIVVSPHPTAAQSTIEALKICKEAAIKAGAPKGLIGWVSHPTLKATEELMRHQDVNLILATGGAGLVKAAYSSGKPAYGVGPGNVPVYIDPSSNVQLAVKKIVESKSFDNSTICATEQAIVVHQEIKKSVMDELVFQGVYVLNEEEKRKVELVISPVPRQLNGEIVGKSAKHIAKLAGIDVPDHIRILLAEETEIGKNYPFSIEKLSPILGLYTATNAQEAISICQKLLDIGGRGHSFSIHANDDALVREFSIQMPVSRVVVNTHAALGAPGGSTSLIPSFTLGCGSYGGNITSDNITVDHLINIKRIAYETKPVIIPQPTHRLKETRIDRNSDVVETIDSKLVTRVVEEVLKKLNS